MSRGHPVSPELRARVLAYYAAGASYQATASAFVLSPTTVGRLVRAHGTPRTPAAGLALFVAREITEEERRALAQSGARGGAAAHARHDRAFWSRIGKTGGEATRAKYGSPAYARWGTLGGRANAAKHGTEHFQTIGKQGAQRVRDLLAKGRAMEEQGR